MRPRVAILLAAAVLLGVPALRAVATAPTGFRSADVAQTGSRSADVAPTTFHTAAPAQDPVRVSATLTRDRIGVGEATTLQLSVETRGAAVDEFRLPVLPRELDVLGTSDFSQMQISVPGGRSRVIRRDILLSAQAPGVYRIPAVTIIVDGRAHQTSPVTLVVTAGGGPSAAIGGGGGAGTGAVRGAAGARPGTELTVQLSADTVYVGQQVLLRAEVTFSDEMRTRQSRPATFDPPAPQGFWVQDLPDPVTVLMRVREGRTVESQTYRRAYFPLMPGQFAFPPAHLYYDMRRGFLNAPESRRLSSDSARIVVLPLPQEGRPQDFSGAVGRLQVRASVRPSSIAAGDATVVELEIEGTGNVKGLPEPTLPRLPGAEVFPPSQESRVDVVNDRVGGTKRFRWVVVPEEPGALHIPPIEYSYFDPELKQYVRLQTEALEVWAEPRPGAAARAESDTMLRPLRVARGREPAPWTRSPAFGAAQLLPVLLVGLTAVVRRRRARPPGPKEHERRIRAGLGRLRAQPADAAALHELERLLLETVRCLAGASGVDCVAELRAMERPQAADLLERLLHELQVARYAPAAAPAELGGLVDQADRLVDMLAPPRRWRRRTAAGAAALVTLAAAATLSLVALPAAVAQPPIEMEEGDVFTAGVASFMEQDFVRAANSFQAYTRSHPRDPNGWYNLGLAAQSAGDPGRAVWAWLRAVRLTPRDADLQHNLRLSGAHAAMTQVRPLDRMSAGERLILAAAAWWLLVLGLAAAARSRAARAAAVAAGVMLAAAGAGAAVTAAQPSLVTPLRSGADLFAGPTARDVQLGRLQAGTVARVLESRGEWLLVDPPGDGRAWVERAAVASP